MNRANRADLDCFWIGANDMVTFDTNFNDMPTKKQTDDCRP